MSDRVLFLIGSPKGLEGSQSGRYAKTFSRLFQAGGWQGKSLHLHVAVKTSAATAELVREASAADLVILIAPLYVDSLPGPAIRALELLAEKQAGTKPEKMTRFAALIHCGFIEPKHNRVAGEICKCFSKAVGWEWFGALMLGGGGIPSKRATRVLEEAADVLAKGFPINKDITKRAEKPTMPRLVYVIGGNLMWRRAAKKHGVRKSDLLAQPYD